MDRWLGLREMYDRAQQDESVDSLRAKCTASNRKDAIVRRVRPAASGRFHVVDKVKNSWLGEVLGEGAGFEHVQSILRYTSWNGMYVCPDIDRYSGMHDIMQFTTLPGIKL